MDCNYSRHSVIERLRYEDESKVCKITTPKRGVHNMQIDLVGEYIAGLGFDAAK